MNNLDGAKIAGVIVAIILMVTFGPFLMIWSVNTLFNLGIAYTFWTWAAALYLSMVINGGRTGTKRN